MLKKKSASFKYAFRGFRIAFIEESNFQIQIAIAIIAVVLGLYFDIDTFEWLIVIGITGLVLTAELFNTALEELCDMLKPHHDPHVGKIKDLAASAVLTASSIALLIGAIIFIPKILAL